MSELQGKVAVGSASGIGLGIARALRSAGAHLVLKGFGDATAIAALRKQLTATTAITCNAICPGWVLTPLVQNQIDDLARRDKLAAEEAKRRLLADQQPSGEFAAQIRGAALSIDGAWTAQ